MNADDRLRDILHAEAERVQTSPAAYDAIKTKFARSRRRSIWQRSMLATATAAAVLITSVVVVTRDDDSSLVVDPPAASESATPATSPQPSPTDSVGPVPTADDYVNAVWPYNTWTEINAERKAGPRPDTFDPRAAAESFIRAFLGEAAWTFGKAREAEPRVVEVDVSRSFGDSTPPVKVTTLTLRAHGDSDDGWPWLVTQALTPGIVITSPEHGSMVTSPLTMSGTVVGIHHSVHAQVRAPDGSSLGEAYEMAGESEPWSTAVSFNGEKAVGSVTATLRSDRDGLPTSFTAVPVRRTFATKGPPPAPAPPETFVAVQGGRLALFRTTSGERVRYLTTEQPGGGITEAQMAPDGATVYAVRGQGTCAASIVAVSTTTQTERTVLSLTDAVPSNLSVSGDGKWLAYVRTKCAGEGDWSIVRRDLGAATERAWSSSASAPESGTVVDLAINESGSKIYYLSNGCCGDFDPDLQILDTTQPGEVLEEHRSHPPEWDAIRPSCGILQAVAVSTSYPDVVVSCMGATSSRVLAVAESGAVETLFTGGGGERLDFLHPGVTLIMNGAWWMPGSGPQPIDATGLSSPTW